jgi:hypothetical protein
VQCYGDGYVSPWRLVRVRILLLAALLALPVYGQVPNQRPVGIASDDELPVVAGYRALFTCSAHFVARRSLSEIKNVELVDAEGIGYPSPLVDKRRRLVTATVVSRAIEWVAAFPGAAGVRAVLKRCAQRHRFNQICS